MEKKEINLFKSFIKKPADFAKKVRAARVASLVLMAGYCVLAFGVFGYGLAIRKKLAGLQEKVYVQEQKIKAYQEKEAQLVLIKQRLTALASYFKQPMADYSAVMEEIKTLFPDSVAVEGLKMTAQGQISLSGEAVDLPAMAGLLDLFSQIGDERLFKSIYLDTLSRKENGSYQFSFKFNVDA